MRRVSGEHSSAHYPRAVQSLDTCFWKLAVAVVVENQETCRSCAALQFAWRPAEGGAAEPPQGAVVTADGALLTGALGAPLVAAEEGVGTAAWSDDGALLAFARQECVTVRDAASGRSFTTRIMSGVRL